MRFWENIITIIILEVRRTIRSIEKIRLFAILFVVLCLPLGAAEPKATFNQCETNFSHSKLKHLIFGPPLTKGEALNKVASVFKNINEIEFEKEVITFLQNTSTNQCIYFFTSHNDDWNALRGIEGFAAVEAGILKNIKITKKS